jgi:hypothetical protein
MALTTIKTGGLADNSVTDAKVADAITVTGAQTGITQVGTLTAGTWNAGVIASAYLDADTAHLSGSTFIGSVQISHGTTPDFTLNDTGGTTNKRVFRISGGGDAVYFEGRNNDNSGDGASGTIQTLSLSDSSVTFAGQVKIDTDQRYFTKWETTYGTDRDYWWRNDGGLLQLGEGAEGDAQVKYTFDTANKRLGIGCTPIEALHVDGQAIIDDANTLATNAVPTTLFINSQSDSTLGFSTRGNGAGCNTIIGIDDSDGDKFKITNHATDIGGADHFVLSGGNVGIGTDSPGLPLEISNDAAEHLRIRRNGSHYWDIIEGGSGDLFLQKNGAADNLALMASGFAAFTGAADVRLTLGTQGTAGTNSANWIRGADAVLSFNSASGGYAWEIAGTTKMSMNSSGNLGIGTSSMTSPAGSLNMLKIQHATGSAGLVLCGNSNNRDDWDIQANDDGNLYFLRGNTTKVLVEGGDGTVQIPGSCQVTGVLTNTTRIVVQKASTSRIMGVENSHGSAPLGIDIVFGGAEPNNTTQWFVQGRDASADEFKIFSDGSYSQISDISVKENISEVDSMISKINELRVVNYNRKKDASKKNHVGIIAQELEEVFPHLISKNDDDTLMVYKIGLVMPLIKAVQELSAKVTALENA